QLVVSAEAQATSAKEKLTLAKEYLQAGNLELAHQTVLAALELDAELVGGIELLPQIESMIEEFNLQQEQEVEEVPLESEAVQNITQQDTSYQVEQAQRLAQAERERAEAQRQAEQAQRERQQALEKEHQKAEEAARKLAAEAARRQNESRFDSQLNRAERAL